MAKKKAWRLVFGEGLLSNYLTGAPEWTFRRYAPGSHEFAKGQIIEGHFLDGVVLLLEVTEATQVKPFSEITKEECSAWGDCSHDEMMDQLRVHYPDLELGDKAALIQTRVARIGERPVAGFLPE